MKQTKMWYHFWASIGVFKEKENPLSLVSLMFLCEAWRDYIYVPKGPNTWLYNEQHLHTHDIVKPVNQKEDWKLNRKEKVMKKLYTEEVKERKVLKFTGNSKRENLNNNKISFLSYHGDKN